MNKGCGGCPYCKFPYKALIPIFINGKREKVTFNNVDDIWSVVDLLIEEIIENNQSGMSFDLAQSISSQLPFFACYNNLTDKEILRDVQRYIYCKELGVSPYKEEFGKHPALWIDRFFVIKKAFAKMEATAINKAKSGAKLPK